MADKRGSSPLSCSSASDTGWSCRQEEEGDDVAAADDDAVDDEAADEAVVWWLRGLIWWRGWRAYKRVMGGRLTALNTSTNTRAFVLTVVTCQPGSDVNRCKEPLSAPPTTSSSSVISMASVEPPPLPPLLPPLLPPVAEGIKDVEDQLAYERSVRELPPPSGTEL